MGRLTTAHAAAMGADVLYPSLFAEFDFASGITRFWTGESDISWNSQTWLAGAHIAGVQLSGEGEDLEARKFVFQLNGVSRDYYSVAVNTQYRNRPVRLWFNLLNSAGNAVTYSYKLEEARMDTLAVSQDTDTITLTLTAESRLLDLFTPNRALMTPADHKLLYPDDDFYKFIQGLAGADLPWGLELAQSSMSTSFPPSRPGWGGGTAIKP